MYAHNPNVILPARKYLCVYALAKRYYRPVRSAFFRRDGTLTFLFLSIPCSGVDDSPSQASSLRPCSASPPISRFCGSPAGILNASSACPCGLGGFDRKRERVAHKVSKRRSSDTSGVFVSRWPSKGIWGLVGFTGVMPLECVERALTRTLKGKGTSERGLDAKSLLHAKKGSR